MTTSFDRAVQFTLSQEGEWSPDHKTRWGIDSTRHPEVDLSTLTRDEAIAFYLANYWQPIRGNDLPWPFAAQLFDFSVNSGISGAVSALQRIVGVKVDGVIGPQTLEEVKRIEALHPGFLSQQLLHARADARIDQATARLQDAHYLNGWIHRVIDSALIT
jgi:lysozyme family protein